MRQQRHICTGCWKLLMPTDPQFRYHFCDTGFSIGSQRLRPCRVSYHSHCLRIRAPFATRLDDNKGLSCPADAVLYKGFICESCRVHSTIVRELQRTAGDITLMMLERATLIDMYNHWSHGTLKAYKSKFNVLREFETDFQLSTIPQPHLDAPPNSDSRPLMCPGTIFVVSCSMEPDKRKRRQ
jgi:hypothetical protein